MNAPIAMLRRPLIVHVVRQFLPNRGGLEDVVFNLCKELLRKGFRVRVVTLDRLFSDPARTLPEREIMDGIEVVRIPWRGSSRYPVAPGVLAHIGDADLVHVHAVDFFFDFLSWTRPMHGKPMIATTHGGFFHTTRHAAVKAIWFRTVTRLSCLGYRELVCCSRSDTALFSRIAGTRAVTIENGADVSKFAGCSSAVPVKRMVTLGRFSVNKRLDNLVRTMASLVSQDPEWALDIIGVPSDLTEPDLPTAIAAAGLGGHVQLHLGLANAEIADVLRKASLFVSASDYEGFGLVAIEAMSAGLLPVLHPNEAYRQLAATNANIVLADFANPVDAAAAVRQAHERLSREGTSLRDALMTSVEAYSWPKAADAYVSAYERAVPALVVPVG